MEIVLRPASEVPKLFVENLQERDPNEQVLATTMSIDFGNNPITDGLVRYGLPEDVLAVDYFGHANGPSASVHGRKDHTEARESFIRGFSGSYVVLGEPARHKYVEGKLMGRSHIKALSVGARILSLGGVNLTNYSYEHSVDAMLDFESEEFTNFLASFISSGGNLRHRDGSGETFQLDEENEVIVDYGKAGKSLIMERVFSDLSDDRVRAVTMSSSYAPAGHLNRLLRSAAAASHEVKVYTNSPEKFRSPDQSMVEKSMQRDDIAFELVANLMDRRATVPFTDCLPRGVFNHLKVIMLRRADGSKIVYMGSHNYHPISVEFGTAEVALRSTDESLIEQIETFIKERLAPSKDRPRIRPIGLRDEL